MGIRRWFSRHRPATADVILTGPETQPSPGGAVWAPPKVPPASLVEASRPTRAMPGSPQAWQTSPIQTPRPPSPRPTILPAAPTPATTRVRPSGQPRPARRGAAPSRHEPAVWLGAGTPATVAGLVIPGGLLYVGSGLAAVSPSRGAEPALIDPTLAVDMRRPDLTGASLNYWPAYDRLSPSARGGYLNWLWTGRSGPTAPIGYVFLYFYGLERRALHDTTVDGADPGELGLLVAQVDRLLSIYGTNPSFHSYATSFRQSIEALLLLGGPIPGLPPEGDISSSWELPPLIRCALGRIAAAGTPMPAGWALAWVHSAPDIYLRTPASRCPDHFARLFEIRYSQTFGDGMTLSGHKTRLQLRYRPASPSFDGEILLPVGDLPDPSLLKGPTEKLQALATAVTDELDAYSRWLGRHPGTEASTSALALLPPEVADGPGAETARLLVNTAEAHLGGGDVGVIHVDRLLACLSSEAPGSPDKSEIAALTQLLAVRGYGLEPDVRHGGTFPADGPVVVFRLFPGHAEPGPDWAVVTATLELVASVLVTSVLVAPEHLDPGAVVATAQRVSVQLQLPGNEQHRIAAHLLWATMTAKKPSGLKRRLASLDKSGRRRVARCLVGLATVNGPATPAQVSALTGAYKALGLDAADVYSRIHQAETGAAQDGEAPQAINPVSDGPARSSPTAGPVTIDFALVQAKQAESDEIGAFLDSVFVDDDVERETDSMLRSSQPPSSVAGLDEAHLQFLRALSSQASWTRPEAEALAARYGLLPDAAIDTVNESALDTIGELLCEGDDPIIVDLPIVNELLS